MNDTLDIRIRFDNPMDEWQLARFAELLAEELRTGNTAGGPWGMGTIRNGKAACEVATVARISEEEIQ